MMTREYGKKQEQKQQWAFPYKQDREEGKLNEDEAATLLLASLPSLSAGMCEPCVLLLQDRLQQLSFASGQERRYSPPPPGNMSSASKIRSELGSHDHSHNRQSWADMVQKDLQDRETEEIYKPSGESVQQKKVLSRDERERIRFMGVGRNRDFLCLEKINGKMVNIMQGLELHTSVFSAAEQKRIVDLVYEVQEKGKKKQLKERTYSEPRKWMKGKGRVTIQFGCCYNYATDKNGNPPGIIQDGEVDPIPPLLKTAIRRLVTWHVLPPSCIPASCIINIYEEGDCIPPHIDHHDFVRPFCTVSFLSECNIVFGSSLKIVAEGEFAGSTSLPLPVGSVLVINGNGADIAKHAIPSVPSKRISITLRKMDPTKIPYNFVPETDLQDIQPLSYTKRPAQSQLSSQPVSADGKMMLGGGKESSIPATFSVDTDFPSLSAQSHSGTKHGKAIKH